MENKTLQSMVYSVIKAGENKGIDGWLIWQKYYNQEPSYKNENENYFQLMKQKQLKVYVKTLHEIINYKK